MPITRHHSGRWLYQFDRHFPAPVGRQRANKLLPKGWTKAQAQAYDQRETARLYELATGGDRPEPLIEDAVLLYLTDHAPSLKNHGDIVGALALLQPWYASKPFSALPDIAQEYAREAVSETGGPLKPATIKNRLAYLRAACRWAWKSSKEFGEHDPAEKMVLPKVRNARHIYLTREQALPVFRAMGLTWSRDAARVAFYTGWRIGEVLRAKPVIARGEVALALSDSKNDLPRIVPVHPKIAHLVRDHWPPKVTKWTVSKAVKAAYRAVGLGHARLHDLRHSAASEMINADVDLYTVGGVLGHKSIVSTQRYAHLVTAKLRTAVDKIGKRSAKISQPGPEAKAA
jgi:integrase